MQSSVPFSLNGNWRCGLARALFLRIVSRALWHPRGPAMDCRAAAGEKFVLSAKDCGPGFVSWGRCSTRPTTAGLPPRRLRGDREAFRRLVERHYAMIYRVAYRYVGSAADAEDIAQDVCVALATRLEKFGGRSRFSTWLVAIVINRCRDLLQAAAVVGDAGGEICGAARGGGRRQGRHATGERPGSTKRCRALSRASGRRCFSSSARISRIARRQRFSAARRARCRGACIWRRST